MYFILIRWILSTIISLLCANNLMSNCPRQYEKMKPQFVAWREKLQLLQRGVITEQILEESTADKHLVFII